MNNILTGTFHILHLWGSSNKQQINSEVPQNKDFQSDPNILDLVLSQGS